MLYSLSTFFRITSVLYVYNFRIKNKTNILAIMHDESSFQGITFFSSISSLTRVLELKI